MRKKIILTVGGNNLGMPLVKQSKGSACGAGVDSLPQSVEHKHWLIEQRVHDIVVGESSAWDLTILAVNV